MDNERLKLIAKLSVCLAIYLVLFLTIIMTPILWPKKRIFMTLFVFSAGVIGGLLSIQQRVKTITIDELQLYTKCWATLIIFPLTGGILALLLYVIFLSGFVQGHLFPQFFIPDFGENPTREHLVLLFKETVTKTGPDFCKLLFWSFVAGFSERFVIRFVNKMTDEKYNGPQKLDDSDKSIS